MTMHKKIKLTAIFVMMFLFSSAYSAEKNIEGLYNTWCLTGMSKELNGELVPDKANYTFTKEGMLKYDAGFFKQEEAFEIIGEKIETESMGKYKIITIEKKNMILNYGGYMYFTLGSCK